MAELSSPPDIDELVRRLGELPAMPAIVADLIASIDDDSVDLDTLARKIERDQSLASKTLRIANSPFFGLAGKVASIQEAATVIGLRTIRSIALASAVGDITRQAAASSDVLQGFWIHAFETAVAARQLAPRAKVSAEHAFVAGLLHDIGKIAVAVFFPDLQQQIVAYCADHGVAWNTAETALGIPEHGAIGNALARRWHFPESLCQTLADYHHPDPSSSALSRVIHVSDVLAQCNAAMTGRAARIDHVDAYAWSEVVGEDRQLHGALRAMRTAGDLAAYMG